MHAPARSVAIVALAFSAGMAVDQVVGQARGAAAPMTAQIVNVAALQPSDLGNPPPGLTARQKIFANTETGTVKVQIGATPKHYHKDTDEIQYVVEGTGTQWFVDKTVSLKPGDLLIIPKGTPHGALSDNVKLLTFQMPPQNPADSHRLP